MAETHKNVSEVDKLILEFTTYAENAMKELKSLKKKLQIDLKAALNEVERTRKEHQFTLKSE